MRSPENAAAVPTRPMPLAENLQVVVAGQEMPYNIAVARIQRMTGSPENMVRANLLLAFHEAPNASHHLSDGVQVSFRLREEIGSYSDRLERLVEQMS